MKGLLPISILAALALPVFAGRTETQVLYEGTPQEVEWRSYKNDLGAWSPFFNISFVGFDPYGWTIPAFDTHGGSRVATGIGINIRGKLQGTFNATSEGRNRLIEGYSKYAALKGVVYPSNGTMNNPYEISGYTDTEFEENIPKAQQVSAMTWNLDSQIEASGPIVNNRGPAYFSFQKFQQLTKGDTHVYINGRVAWFPYYRFDNDFEPFSYADCGTTWAIPNESFQENESESVDELGRSLQGLIGTPGFPRSTYNIRTTVRRGSASPIRLEIVYHYTQAGDADHELDPYHAAGKYADDFASLDAYGLAESGNGDRILQPQQWVFLDGPVVGLPFDSFYSDSDMRRSFEWMDTDRNQLVSPAEFLAWRDYVATFLTRFKDKEISEAFPREDWTLADPTPKQASAKLLKLPTLAERAFLAAVDRDRNKKLSRVEWSYFYPLAALERLDSNKDSVITLHELTSTRIEKSTPAIVAKAIARTELFLTLDKDVHRRMDRDSKISRDEAEKMWPPGTRDSKIDTIWKSVAGSDLKAISLTHWLKAVTLPTISECKAATSVRMARSLWFKENSWFDSQTDLSRSEFERLFKAGTASKVINESWRVANSTPDGKTPPEIISALKFVECRLIDTTLK